MFAQRCIDCAAHVQLQMNHSIMCWIWCWTHVDNDFECCNSCSIYDHVTLLAVYLTFAKSWLEKSTASCLIVSLQKVTYHE